MNDLTVSELIVSDVVKETKALLGGVRKNLLKVAANLHFLRDSGEYEGRFGQYVEEEFGLNQGTTSQLLTIWDAWVVRAGILPGKIDGIDHRKLYDFVPLLEGKTEAQALAEVQTWNRDDIKKEKQDKAPHEPEYHLVCTVCWATKENHP